MSTSPLLRVCALAWLLCTGCTVAEPGPAEPALSVSGFVRTLAGEAVQNADVVLWHRASPTSAREEMDRVQTGTDGSFLMRTTAPPGYDAPDCNTMAVEASKVGAVVDLPLKDNPACTPGVMAITGVELTLDP